MKLADIAKRFRIDRPDTFRLSEHDCGETCGLDIDKSDAKDMLADGLKRLEALQEKLYAQDRWSVLIVLQAMDAAGKDGVIKHVMTAIDPQGCDVHSFKQPNDEELSHDFLWRAARRLPERGRVGIFNRSYYEDVLVVRVHPDYLARAQIPESLIGADIWTQRFEDIRNFERHLARNGTRVLKFFLNISRDEQRKRFLDRLDDPTKQWKFSAGDIAERELWPKYMEAYEDAIRATSTDDAPWYVVPGDHKWFGRLVVAAAVVDALERLKPEYPNAGDAVRERMAEARKALASGA
jgi:PPK2 family polyphosphate:nucleotide phosphotransferase